MKMALVLPILFSLPLLADNVSHANDETRLGEIAYKDGQFDQAMQHFLKASQQGDPVARLDIGAMYERGHGVDKSPETAAKWYRMSADAGNTNAEINLATMYRTGNGLPQSMEDAVKWYRTAASQGSSKAKRILQGLCDNDATLCGDE